jgi:hypothetical protein
MEFINNTAKAVACATMIQAYRLGKVGCFTHYEEVMINKGYPIDPDRCISFYEDLASELQDVEPTDDDVKMYLEILRDLQERYRYHYLNDITEEG